MEHIVTSIFQRVTLYEHNYMVHTFDNEVKSKSLEVRIWNMWMGAEIEIVLFSLVEILKKCT